MTTFWRQQTQSGGNYPPTPPGAPGVPFWPQTLAPSTLVGRLSSTTGPTEAIPFASFISANNILVTGSTEIRTKLGANRTYYVLTTGSDSNTGLVNTAAGAFLTINKAVQVARRNLDFGPYDVVIEIGAGTFSESINIDTPLFNSGGGTLTLNGVGNTTILDSSTGIIAQNGATVSVTNMKITSSLQMCLSADNHGTIRFSTIDFGAAGLYHFFADRFGFIIADGNWSISGSPVGGHIHTAHTGNFRAISRTVTISADISVGTTNDDAFISCYSLGDLTWQANTISLGGHTVTGRRFYLRSLGTISGGAVEALGLTHFPGTVAGKIEGCGAYDDVFYAPKIIGGNGTTGTQLTLQTTNGVGTTDAFVLLGGNNGNTTFMTVAAANAAFTMPLGVTGVIASSGASAGFQANRRDAGTGNWVIYSAAGNLQLFSSVLAGDALTVFPSGAAGLGSSTDPGTAGVLNVSVGFRIANAAASGALLAGNGTNFVSTATGTGVITALGVNVGSAGAFVTFNGALGTPSSGALASCTGYTVTNLVCSATNDSAASGKLGEYVEGAVASGSAVSLTTGTVADITNISLTAGDWDVEILCEFQTGTATNVTILVADISLAAAASGLDTTAGRLSVTTFGSSGLAMTNALDIAVIVPRYRLSLASTTTVYFLARGTFTVSTLKAWGIISARRVR